MTRDEQIEALRVVVAAWDRYARTFSSIHCGSDGATWQEWQDARSAHSDAMQIASALLSSPAPEDDARADALVICDTWRHGAVDALVHVRTATCANPRAALSTPAPAAPAEPLNDDDGVWPVLLARRPSSDSYFLVPTTEMLAGGLTEEQAGRVTRAVRRAYYAALPPPPPPTPPQPRAEDAGRDRGET